MVGLRSANMRKTLSVYSWCLTANVVTIYLFECLMIALKPVVIPSGVYILEDGPAGFLPISIRFIGLWIFLLMLVAHVAAMATCVLYQWAQITSSRPTWLLQASYPHAGLTVAFVSVNWASNFWFPVTTVPA